MVLTKKIIFPKYFPSIYNKHIFKTKQALLKLNPLSVNQALINKNQNLYWFFSQP